MFKFGFGLSVFVGVVLYEHTTTNLAQPHETGVAVGLVMAILSLAVVYAWSSSSASSLTQGDRYKYKTHAHKRNNRPTWRK